MGQVAQQDKIIFTNKKGSFDSSFNPEDWGGVKIAEKLFSCIEGGTIGDVLVRTKEGNKISTASFLSWGRSGTDFSMFFCKPDGSI